MLNQIYQFFTWEMMSNATAQWWFSSGEMSLYRMASSVLAFTYKKSKFINVLNWVPNFKLQSQTDRVHFIIMIQNPASYPETESRIVVDHHWTKSGNLYLRPLNLSPCHSPIFLWFVRSKNLRETSLLFLLLHAFRTQANEESKRYWTV